MNNPALKKLVELYDEEWSFLKQLCEMETTELHQLELSLQGSLHSYEEHVMCLRNCFELLDIIVQSKVVQCRQRIEKAKEDACNIPIEVPS